MFLRRTLPALFFLFLTAFSGPCFAAKAPAKNDAARLALLLEQVYKTMDDYYYLPVSRQTYEDFTRAFPAKRLKDLNDQSKKTEDFVHLGAGLLVNKLKSPADKFTNFLPPSKTKEFKSKVYAVTEDLGIEGTKTAEGFQVTKVQKHSEAYAQGLRTGDILLKIDGVSLGGLEEKEIRTKLSPVLGSFVKLEVFLTAKKQKTEITLESKSYFRETVSMIDSGLPGVPVLKIAHFNQKTSEDFADELAAYGVDSVKHLVLDLRDNDGGPPLAAREILGFFLPANDHLFAIARKKKSPVMLTAPATALKIKAPVTVLVNQKTGSAAEMFSGMLQAKKIAVLVGEKTAGATYLKSIYDFDDGSMVFMITSLTFFYDRRVYPADGLTPDTPLAEGQDALRLVLDGLR